MDVFGGSTKSLLDRMRSMTAAKEEAQVASVTEKVLGQLAAQGVVAKTEENKTDGEAKASAASARVAEFKRQQAAELAKLEAEEKEAQAKHAAGEAAPAQAKAKAAAPAQSVATQPEKPGVLTAAKATLGLTYRIPGGLATFAGTMETGAGPYQRFLRQGSGEPVLIKLDEVVVEVAASVAAIAPPDAPVSGTTGPKATPLSEGTVVSPVIQAAADALEAEAPKVAEAPKQEEKPKRGRGKAKQEETPAAAAAQGGIPAELWRRRQ
jgi:hypothetical protein